MSTSKSIYQAGQDGSPLDIQPIPVLQERLSASIYCPHGQEAFLVLQGRQGFHLLTRDEIRQFHQLLLVAQIAMNHLSPPPEKHEETCEAAEATLYTKVHLVRRKLSLPWPGFLDLAASPIMLSRDELAVLEVDAMFLVQDIELDEATYCYAVVPCARERCVRHLVHKSRRQRRGPVLCGCTPPDSDVLSPSSRGWFFVPFAGRPTGGRGEPLCPRCLEHWQAQQQKGVMNI